MVRFLTAIAVMALTGLSSADATNNIRGGSEILDTTTTFHEDGGEVPMHRLAEEEFGETASENDGEFFSDVSGLFDEHEELMLEEQELLVESFDEDTTPSAGTAIVLAEDTDNNIVRRLPSSCVNDKGQIEYFDIEISIKANTAPTNCDHADAIMMGNDINIILRNNGIGEAGVNDNAIYRAGVCPKPQVVNRRRLLIAQKSFVFLGGGSCRFCPVDNWDARRSLLSFTSSSGATTTDRRELASVWFNTVFRPNLEKSVEDAIKSDIVPRYPGCLGTNPTISATVLGISKADYEQPCAKVNTGGLQFLDTFNPTDYSLGSGQSTCSQCVSINFNTRGDGRPTAAGDYVRFQWINKGLRIDAKANNGGYTPNQNARLFDTSNPTADPDLGSPNAACPGGGKGVGNGGMPGRSGANCRSLGRKYTSQQSSSCCWWLVCLARLLVYCGSPLTSSSSLLQRYSLSRNRTRQFQMTTQEVEPSHSISSTGQFSSLTSE